MSLLNRGSEVQPPGCTLELAEMVKKVVNIPVIAVGKLGYPQLAEKVLREGKADFVALGRALLADPDWPNKVKEKRFEDVRPCVGCLEGCRGRVHDGKAISCSVNPATGNERELAIRPAERKKSVLVIGGGPARMEAARIAAVKGHKVILWEKSETLGGNLVPASVPDFKQDYRSLLDYLFAQIQKLGVDIELGKEATPELVQAVKPEVVFVATGSTPDADTAALAAGLRASDQLLEALSDKLPEVYPIGDCLEPRRIIHAIWEGFRTARLI